MYRMLYKCVLTHIDPEKCHNIGIKFLRYANDNRVIQHLFSSPVPNDKRLNVKLCGIDFKNPIGMAAGFDKNVEVFPSLLSLGFGHVECGTITYFGRTGNSGKRIWRFEDGLINNMGIPNLGFHKVQSNMNANKIMKRTGIVGISVLPMDKSFPSLLISGLCNCVDYLTINISCPNIHDIRWSHIDYMLKNTDDVRRYMHDNFGKRTPLFMKLGPMTEDDQRSLIDLALKYNIDGLVMTNTMPATNISKDMQGGVSGKRLKYLAMRCVRTAYRHTGGELPIIGTGGVSSVDDVLLYIKNGASLVQLYTGFVMNGPRLPVKILNGLIDNINRNNWDSISSL
ncbi:MAG: dihydroorotate dehydrogenase (quinone), partial [Candidatus Hodarchaeales archaeon]